MKSTNLFAIAMLLVAVLTGATFEDNGYGIGDYAMDFKLKNIVCHY